MRGLVVLVAIALAGCGGAEGGNSSENPFTKGFNDGFRKSFREKFVTQCVAGAKSSSQSATINFEPICACSADKLLATKTPTQLMGGGPTAEEEKAVIAACVKEHPIGG